MSARAPGDPRCKDCPADHEPNRVRCAACAERRKLEQRAIVKARRKSGRCLTCGKTAAKRKRDGELGRYCKEHAAYYLARSKIN